MTRYTMITKLLFAALVGGSMLWINSSAAVAQQENSEKPARKQTNQAGRDPFRKYEPPKIVERKNGQVMPPPIQQRIQEYKAQRLAAMKARVPAPKPTTALLLSEVQVVGISRTPRGYAAIVEATPIKLSYVIYPGEKFYDGQLVAIEDSRLVFRKEIVLNDGRRERSVETKALRQPTNISEMAAANSVSSSSSVENSSEQKSKEASRP